MSESTRTLELAAPAPLSSAAAALAMAEAGAAAPLSRNFLRAQKLYGDVESSRLGGADAALQRQVGEALALCEVALKQVVGLSVFSSNEMVDDVNTGDLKYLLLPFYRGELLQRVVDQPRRRELLGESLACLRGFLDDLERMEALTAEARAAWRADGEPSAAADPAAVREAKIARVKASKAARDRMAVLAERQRGLGEDDDGTLPRNFSECAQFSRLSHHLHRRRARARAPLVAAQVRDAHRARFDPQRHAGARHAGTDGEAPTARRLAAAAAAAAARA